MWPGEMTEHLHGGVLLGSYRAGLCLDFCALSSDVNNLGLELRFYHNENWLLIRPKSFIEGKAKTFDDH